ncbi:MAG: HAMP domain-containing histidine kinase [Sandaracinaceae bacterium]|nr:HAMP domain-containing histidine kinase [Sandaracinaceae bacterium]
MTGSRRRLWLRVALVVTGILLVEAIAFVVVVRRTRSEVLLIGYHRQLDLLEDTGALARCDADPEAFVLPERVSGRVVPLRSDGAPFAPGVEVPDLSEAAARLEPGGHVPVGSPWLAWPAVLSVERAGPCRAFYMTPPVPEEGMPLMTVIAVRLVLAAAVVFAILWLVMRPLTRRIDRLAAQTRALTAADLRGRVDEGADELGEVGAVINAVSAQARRLLDAEVAQRELLHELFADLAHDVRTPLASVKLSTDALAHGDDPDEVATALRVEVEYLDAMFANLATIARLRSTVLPIERRPGDLRELAEHVRDRFHPLARDRGVTLDLATPDHAVERDFDPLTLEQALGNVVHNAIKYARAHVAILIVEHGEIAELRVIDDGPGVRETDRARLTERRFRAADSKGRKGLGLGLAIADRIVERHDGSLDIDPYEGGGTCVTLRLPPMAPRPDEPSIR